MHGIPGEAGIPHAGGRPVKLGRGCALRNLRRASALLERGRGVLMASSYTVLLVDDDVDAREITAHMLGSRGFDVLVAQSGHEAMRVLAKIRPDVLLADIVMPDLNGIELAKRAKLLQPDLKVAFMTGYYSRAAEAARLGKLLFKPVRGAEIETELRNLIAEA